VFCTKDGHINIAANKQEQWESVCDALGLPELKTDARFQKRDVRKQNRKELTPLLEAKLAERGTQEWVELLNASGVPSGAILDLGEALQQPQIKHRETLKDVPVEGIGTVPLFTLTAKFEQTPGAITSAPPRLSAHTAEVLAGIGITKDELADLKTKHVI
jgi:formyl-CoA transferase